jgi:hypothetical protein
MKQLEPDGGTAILRLGCDKSAAASFWSECHFVRLPDEPFGFSTWNRAGNIDGWYGAFVWVQTLRRVLARPPRRRYDHNFGRTTPLCSDSIAFPYVSSNFAHPKMSNRNAVDVRSVVNLRRGFGESKGSPAVTTGALSAREVVCSGGHFHQAYPCI